MSDPEFGVVLMALGGPSSLEEVEPYLRAMRTGRETPTELVDEFRERYRRIGGRSPLLEISRAQARGLEACLAEHGRSAPCEVGMRFSSPGIPEAVDALVARGVRTVIGICLTPYFSSWSVGGYLTALREATEAIRRPVELRTVESWNTQPGLVATYVAAARRGLAVLAEAGVGEPAVLYTAHSLPGVSEPEREPYVLQLHETRALIERELPPRKSRFAYQSVGRRAGPWLGPPAEQEIERLADEGERGLLVVPFGFVSDNLEILYDVDLEFREIAERRGLALARTDSPNESAGLVDALARAVESAFPPS